MYYTEEIKTLKQQVVSLRTHLKSKTEEAEQYKVCLPQNMHYIVFFRCLIKVHVLSVNGLILKSLLNFINLTDLVVNTSKCDRVKITTNTD